MTLAEPTLAEMRLLLAPQVAQEAAFDGWSDMAVANAARALGLPEASARLAFEGGAMDMIAAWIEYVDLAMAEALPAERLGNLPIRERIRSLVQFRLDQVSSQREAVRRALAIMAMPQNLAQAAKLGWGSADAMWRLAGDTSTDYNHYTKRMLLAGIYSATLTVMIDDKSDDMEDTRAFLERRIAGVMKFEKVKAKWLGGDREHFSMARFLGRLRYPAK
jgi:ubiquinone biosynthesis protein COQ9